MVQTNRSVKLSAIALHKSIVYKMLTMTVSHTLRRLPTAVIITENYQHQGVVYSSGFRVRVFGWCR